MPPWLVSVAFAEPPAPPPEDVPSEASEEVVVWGRAVEEAREAVIAELDRLGYDKAKERDGRTVYRNEAAWKGKVVLYDDAYLQVRRTGPSTKKPPMFAIGDVKFRNYPLCIVVPTTCLSAGAFTLSESRWRGVEDDVAVAVGDPLSTMGDRIADQAVGKTLDALPVSLELLWTDGAPLLAEGEALRTAAERRAALLAFWDSRTENDWGRQVREIVESFVRAVVQDSDTPFTQAEMDAFEARRRSSSPFPWTMDIVGASE